MKDHHDTYGDNPRPRSGHRSPAEIARDEIEAIGDTKAKAAISNLEPENGGWAPAEEVVSKNAPKSDRSGSGRK